ncbi:hypothetical protein [Ralstonia solanacearum]|uniref:hypothetical protein n=1 Tax=Ralstonia solanacearum TaxID=305 RepID=UPI0018D06746|nr:hypothetical protein [Ralstonia solanacearum]
MTTSGFAAVMVSVISIFRILLSAAAVNAEQEQRLRQQQAREREQAVQGPVVPAQQAGPILSVKGSNNASDSTGSPPPNMSPDGAGRQGAFNEAKRQNGILVSQQPSDVYPNTDRRGNRQPGCIYEFTVPAPGAVSRK